MSTAVTALMIRPYMPGMYADLGAGNEVRTVDADSGLTTLTFVADLDAPTVSQIRDRMTSRDDTELAARTDLRVVRDEAVNDPTLGNVLALVVALTNYQLGESP